MASLPRHLMLLAMQQWLPGASTLHCPLNPFKPCHQLPMRRLYKLQEVLEQGRVQVQVLLRVKVVWRPPTHEQRLGHRLRARSL